MGEAAITIHGHAYEIACDDGQEERVRALGDFLDARVQDIARGGGASTETHLLVLAALILADENHDLRQRLTEFVNRAGENVPANPAAPQVSAEEEHLIADAIQKICGRIDALSMRISRRAS